MINAVSKATHTRRRLIGIMGGTFDPIHYGHLRVAQGAKRALSADDMRLLPCRLPPHRSVPASSEHDRLTMLQLALEEYPELQLDTREYQRGGLSYSVDTLAELRRELGQEIAIAWLMGVDAFNHLDTWERWEKLADYAHIAVAIRPGAELSPSAKVDCWLNSRLVRPELLRESSCGAVTLLDIPPVDISATQVRRQLQLRAAIDEWLPPAVANYIREKKLYI